MMLGIDWDWKGFGGTTLGWIFQEYIHSYPELIPMVVSDIFYV